MKVDVHHRRVEVHVGHAVEERERSLDVALVAQGDLPRDGLGLLEQQSVEVL